METEQANQFLQKDQNLMMVNQHTNRACNRRDFNQLLQNKINNMEQYEFHAPYHSGDAAQMQVSTNANQHVDHEETDILRREKHDNEMELRKLLGEEKAANVKNSTELAQESQQLSE